MTGALMKIKRILADGKWHRYGEIVKTTGLSPATVSKHFKKLRDVIEKKIDFESGEYPYPVYYKAREAFLQLYDNEQVIRAMDFDSQEYVFGGELREGIDTHIALIDKREKIPIDTTLIIGPNLNPRTIITETGKMFNLYAKALVNTIRNGVALQTKYEHPLFGLKSFLGEDPHYFEKEMQREKDIHNFEATLILHVNGKKWVDKYDWDTLVKYAQHSDKVFQNIKKLEDKQVPELKKVIEDYSLRLGVVDAIEHFYTQTHIIKYSIKEGYVGKSEQEMVNKIVQKAAKGLPEGYPKETIFKEMTYMQEKGLFKIVPTTIYTIQLTQKFQQQREKLRSIEKEHLEKIGVSKQWREAWEKVGKLREELAKKVLRVDP